MNEKETNHIKELVAKSNFFSEILEKEKKKQDLNKLKLEEKENTASSRRESILSSFKDSEITEGAIHKIPHIQKNLTVSKKLQDI